MLLREIASELTIAPAEVDAERGVVLSEQRVRDGPGYREGVAEIQFQLEGQLAARRMPIGLVETIRTAPAALLRDFYETEYRPDNAVLVAVGEIDPAAMEAAVRARFGDWAARRRALLSAALGDVARRGATVRSMVEAGLPPSLSLSWVNAYDPAADTVARGRRDIADVLAVSVLNRRLDRLEQATDAPFISARAGYGNYLRSAALARISVQPKPGGWTAALTAAVAAVRQLAELGAHEDEIARAVTETRLAMRTAAEGAATRRSERIANGIVQAAREDEVYADPVQEQAEVEAILARLTPADVTASARRMFSGSGPLVFAAGAEAVPGGDAALASTLALAMAQPVAEAAREATATWPYAPAAVPGAVAVREEIADLGVTQATFANRVRVLVKPTDFARDEIQVRVRVGRGRLGIAPEAAQGTWMVAGLPLLRQGGTEALTYEQIEALTAGNRVGMNFSLEDDAFVLSGTTRPADLDMQLQLLQAYLTGPALRAAPFARLKAAMGSYLGQLDTTAAGVFGRDVPALLRGGDARWRAVPGREALEAATPEGLAALLEADFAAGPLEVTVVGDVAADRALAAVAASFGALPERLPRAPSAAALRFPAPAEAPVLTHAGRPDQAMAMAAWPTTDFFADPQLQRVLGVMANILQSRLTERLRAAEGVTYSPSVATDSSRTFAGYGYVRALVETPADRVESFYAELDRMAAALAAAAPSADEMERAKRPMLDQRIKWLRENSYWTAALSAAAGDARQFDGIRKLVSGTAAVTAGEVMEAARRFLVKGTEYRVAVRPARGRPPPVARSERPMPARWYARLSPD